MKGLIKMKTVLKTIGIVMISSSVLLTAKFIFGYISFCIKEDKKNSDVDYVKSDMDSIDIEIK